MKILGIILLVTFSMHGLEELDLPGYAVKKLKKALEEVYPESELNLSELDLIHANVDFNIDDVRVFKIENAGESSGFLYMDKAPSQHDRFDYAVVFNSELEISKALVLIYREDYGAEIGSKRWLRQFEGKTSSCKIKIGDDIQGISGATISCGSATKNIKKSFEHMNELKTKGLLN